MKKSLLLLAVAIGFASASYGQTSYGLKAGVTFPKFVAKSGSISSSSKASTSFYLTGYMDSRVANNLSIQPGISLQGKGGKGYDDSSLGNAEAKIDLMYIEVPVNFVYYIPAGSGDVFLGAGPYVGFGLSAKGTLKNSSGSISESSSFKDAGFNVFDGGLNFLAGYKLSQGFLLNGGYSLGLANIAKDSGGATVKNRVFSVGIGYQF